jgi:hypothetical protein
MKKAARRRTSGVVKVSLILVSVLLCLCACAQKASAPEQSPAREPPKTVKGPTIIHVAALTADRSRRDKAARLDAEGERLADSGKLPESADVFRQAILADSTYPAAHYHLARVLAALRGQGDASLLQEMWDELSIGVGMDATLKDSVRTDPSLDPIREDDRLKGLLASEEKPAETGLRGMLEGWWRDENGRYALQFKDQSYRYTYMTERVEIKTMSEGEWELDEKSGELTLHGATLTYAYSNGGQEEMRPFIAAELDPASLVLTLVGGQMGAPDYRELLLQKLDTPLDGALSKMDLPAIARLLGQGIVPGPLVFKSSTENGYAASRYLGPYALKKVLESRRVALIRLFLGKEGVVPYPNMVLPGGYPYRELVVGFQDQYNRARIAHKTGTRYPEENYRALVGHPLWSWGDESSATGYLMDYNDRYVALVESRHAQGENASVHTVKIFDADAGKMIEFGTFPASQNASLYQSMSREDGVILFLMDNEAAWIPMLQKYGLSFSNKVLELTPPSDGDYPVSMEVVGQETEENNARSEGNIWGPPPSQTTRYSYSIKAGSIEVATVEETECQVVGYFTLGAKGKGYIVVVISGRRMTESGPWIDTYLESAAIGS